MEDCGKKGVKAAIVLSGGFSEEGEEGNRLEENMVSIARKAGIRIIGPNTTGVLNTATGFTSSWIGDLPISKGNVAFVAQTGNFAGVLFEHIATNGLLGFSCVVGLGNKCDVNEADVLEYLLEDPRTKVIMMYLEGISQGRQFLQVTRRIVSEKPLVILKSGVTEAGKIMALSHTASIAGDDRIFDAVCARSGMIRVSNFEEIIDLAQALSSSRLPKGKRVAIVDWSGASCVISSDAMAQMPDGLEYAQLSTRSVERLREVTPPWHKISNPIDLTPAMISAGPDRAYEAAVDVLIEDQGVDAGIVSIAAVDGMIPDDEIFKRPLSKPIMLSIVGNRIAAAKLTDRLRQMGYPVFPFTHRAMRALHGMYQASKAMDNRD
jgi:acyl-CoA synthetase (NDP forming)